MTITTIFGLFVIAVTTGIAAYMLTISVKIEDKFVKRLLVFFTVLILLLNVWSIWPFVF